MEQGWIMIYSTQDMHEASIIKGLLESEEIRVVTMNKSGFPYHSLGDVEFYVFWQQAERALEIIYKAIE